MNSEPDIGQTFVAFRKTGDPEALARVFDATAQRLLMVAVHLSRDDVLAQDLVQSAFIRAVEGADNYDAGRPFLPWITGILVHEAKMELRRRGRVPDPDRLPQRAEPRPDEVAASRELEEILARTVASMPEPYRRVLALRLVHGLRNVEIAHALGIPAETVRTQVHRGLQSLRRLLPAGLASTLAVLASDSGMAATRQAVLEAAAHAAPPSVAGTAGATAMKKLTLGAGGLLVVGVCYAVLAAAGSEQAPLPTDPELAGVAGNSAAPAVAAGTATLVADPPRSAVPQDVWRLTGRVTDPQGEPVPDAAVRALAEWGDLVEEFPQVRTDTEGVYEIDLGAFRQLGILRRTMAKIRAGASAPGMVPVVDRRAFVSLPESSDGTRTFRLNLEVTPGSRLLGHVLRSDLTPVEGARVYAQLQSEERTPRLRGTTEADGRYEIALDREGSYELEAVADRDGVAQTELGTVTLGADVTAPDLVLEPHEVLQGRLVMQDGSPFAHMRVDLFHQELGRVSSWGPPKSAERLRKLSTRTDADGLFRAAVVDAGAYRLRLRQARGGQQEFTLHTGAPPAEFVIAGQQLTVRVVDERGHPLPGCSFSYKGWLEEEADSLETIQVALLEDRYPGGAGGAGNLDDVAGERRLLLPVGGMFLFDAVASDEGLTTRDTWIVEAGLYHAEFDMVLRPMAAARPLAKITLSVTDDAGRPQDDLEVRWRSTRMSGQIDSLGMFRSR